MSKKLVTVFGATGLQGGSVVNALLAEGFAVRAVTRSAAADKAKALKAKGVEIAELDVTKASVADVQKAIHGSYGAFLLTNFWDPTSMGKEEELGKKLVDGAHKAGVKHVMWSGLANVAKHSNNKWHVPHFTDKAKVSEYIESLQAGKTKAFEHTTIVAPSFYFQNFQMFGLVKQEGDTFVFNTPALKFLTAMDINEMGPAVAVAFKEPARFDGKMIEYWGEHASIHSYIDTLQRVTGKKARLNEITVEQYKKLGYPGAEEMAATFGWFDESSYYGPNGQPFALWSGQKNTKGGLSNFAKYLENGNWK